GGGCCIDYMSGCVVGDRDVASSFAVLPRIHRAQLCRLSDVLTQTYEEGRHAQQRGGRGIEEQHRDSRFIRERRNRGSLRSQHVAAQDGNLVLDQQLFGQALRQFGIGGAVPVQNFDPAASRGGAVYGEIGL